jgi:hypothetical protein
MYRLIGSGRPGYLFDGLHFGRSARLFNLIISSDIVISACASSFFVQGAILWNGLSPAFRREKAVWGGLEMSVCLICIDLQLLVLVMCEFFFLLFIFSISFLFSFNWHWLVVLLFLLILLITTWYVLIHFLYMYCHFILIFYILTRVCHKRVQLYNKKSLGLCILDEI